MNQRQRHMLRVTPRDGLLGLESALGLKRTQGVNDVLKQPSLEGRIVHPVNSVTNKQVYMMRGTHGNSCHVCITDNKALSTYNVQKHACQPLVVLVYIMIH